MQARNLDAYCVLVSHLEFSVQMFSKILKAYVNEISNPFYDPAIESRELSKAIQQNPS